MGNAEQEYLHVYNSVSIVRWLHTSEASCGGLLVAVEMGRSIRSTLCRTRHERMHGILYSHGFFFDFFLIFF